MKRKKRRKKAKKKRAKKWQKKETMTKSCFELSTLIESQTQYNSFISLTLFILLYFIIVHFLHAFIYFFLTLFLLEACFNVNIILQMKKNILLVFFHLLYEFIYFKAISFFYVHFLITCSYLNNSLSFTYESFSL